MDEKQAKQLVDNPEEYLDLLRRQNKKIKNAKRISQLGRDMSVFSQLPDIVLQQFDSLNDSREDTLDGLTDRLLALYPAKGSAGMGLDFDELGTLFLPLHRDTRVASFLGPRLGGLGELQSRSTASRSHLATGSRRTAVSQKRSEMKDDEPGVIKSLLVVSEVVEALREPVPYFELVINPFSFDETVENMFFMSELLLKKRASVDMRDGVPYVAPCVAGESKSSGSGVSERVFVHWTPQMTFPLFLELCEAFRVTRNLIPSRRKLGAEAPWRLGPAQLESTKRVVRTKQQQQVTNEDDTLFETGNSEQTRFITGSTASTPASRSPAPGNSPARSVGHRSPARGGVSSARDAPEPMSVDVDIDLDVKPEVKPEPRSSSEDSDFVCIDDFMEDADGAIVL